MNREKTVFALLPIVFGFFITGFVDVVGISSSYVQRDFNLSDTMANFLPFAVFIWFFIFSIPTGMLMNRVGRKTTVQISNGITLVAMMIPFVYYSYASCLLAFGLLGIANTMLQVAQNPLLANVVSGKQLTGALTTGQFIKAISSFSGPFIAAFAASYFGSWQTMFPLFAGITLISSIWLQVSPIPREQQNQQPSTFPEVWGLLSNKTVLLLFLGILFIVGLDVGINITTPKLLMERCQLPLQEAGYGVSVYFACRTIGTFIGAFLLARYSASGLLKISTLVAVSALALLFFASDKMTIFLLVGIVGFAGANVFPILFSMALGTLPYKANEISGLMVTGVAGGALIPLVMGVITDHWGSQLGAVAV
ncbi:MAG: MFS transporter, partial [Parapedobacter sp.]